ncbi:restriction endonuclease [Alkalibacter saccharofermentans]|uniref:Restriction endonuclease n=1 Tax=Alkalibacter saccharofermentans DSM 14828 TaxID=1120975 RepID=A0A1M5A8D2_9FIRM|nr:restriction endonuclease [Alkalibacter saccharofermentans]SHF26132.1 Restriction endonuclease [Alkalibacter saccharofermentans DSM 14828]
MNSIIKIISQEFLNEAKASPRMLEDLAAMEKYMSESYDGRTFIELLQNADDTGAKKVIAFTVGDSLIVANDGRPFDKNDIMAICRSGASDKQRGNNIGYRGIGFKSTTTISTEIVIHSANAFFTFSKSVCAKTLGMQADRVPTVRIPFLYDEKTLTKELRTVLSKYKCDGFTTFFIFTGANITKFIGELETFDEGWLLFLKSVAKVEINCSYYSKKCEVVRNQLNNKDCIVGIAGKDKQWYLITSNNVSLAFKYDSVKGIIPCENEEAVFHCFLPTLDKTGFPFKVNADFSTDPSRKHIILDEITNASIKSLQHLYAETIVHVARTNDVRLYQIIALLCNHTTLNSLVSQFENGLLEKLRTYSWVTLNNGQYVSPSNAKLFQKWLNRPERLAVLQVASFLADYTVREEWLEFIDKIDTLLVNLGATEIHIRDLVELMTKPDCVRRIPIELMCKIFVYGNRSLFFEEELLGRILVPTNNGFSRLIETDSDTELNIDYVNGIKNLLNAKETENIIMRYPAYGLLLKNKYSRKPKIGPLQDVSLSSVANSTRMTINKWKTPVQNCISLESLLGFTAKNVEKKSTEYSVVSTSPDGEVFYIAVKNVGTLGDSFKLSEAEYVAAQRYGAHYKVYLFSTETNEVEYTVIINPLDTIPMKKVVKEWEWMCNDYNTGNKPSTNEAGAAYEMDQAQTLETNFDNMDGVQFERFCAQLLMKNGYEDVSMTITSGDQGIDIIAYQDSIKYGIQCKCYSSDIGNSAVQEVYAGKNYYKCNVGIVMTNQRFTPSAIQLAECNGVILWDRDILLKLIKKAH